MAVVTALVGQVQGNPVAAGTSVVTGTPVTGTGNGFITGELVGFETKTRSLGASGIGLLREAWQQNCDREGAAAAEKLRITPCY